MSLRAQWLLDGRHLRERLGQQLGQLWQVGNGFGAWAAGASASLGGRLASLRGDCAQLLASRPLLERGIAWAARAAAACDRGLRYVILEAVAIPRIVAQQLVAVALLRISIAVMGTLHGGWQALLGRFTLRGRERRALRADMANCASYDEWLECAQRYDEHEGTAAWRADRDSGALFDARQLERTTRELERMAAEGDCFSLIFRLRGGLSRGRFGLLHDGLYNKAKAGTKLSVERYRAGVVRALETIVEMEGGTGLSSPDLLRPAGLQDEAKPRQGSRPEAQAISTEVKLAFFNEAREMEGGTGLSSPDLLRPAGLQDEAKPRQGSRPEAQAISTEVKLAFFNEARHAFGRTALMLSGGAALGFYHVGLIRSLMDAGQLPRVISGASAGSIMASIVGTHTDAELEQIIASRRRMRFDFIKPDAKTLAHPVFKLVSGVYTPGGIYRRWRNQTKPKSTPPSQSGETKPNPRA
eukprot:CAMPEP_0172644478 /NCGR_PEP_ID=MMETSP1068-20121228/239232_1 /TAXON_ID=35684 /ORGANISM="Pseudopedinella elastica, Strain CCMP716" /LENGTH=469 /DNA_ID=CAMNT_0013458677 /DNA_START=125 /DNA_END=1531 /DNA_ORIENTATION=+